MGRRARRTNSEKGQADQHRPLEPIDPPPTSLKRPSAPYESCRSFQAMQCSHQIHPNQSLDEEDMTHANSAAPAGLLSNILDFVFNQSLGLNPTFTKTLTLCR